MISIKGLTKCYEPFVPVLDGIDLTIPTGSVFGLVGVNGAGKSTLLRIIAGVMKQDAGIVKIDGEEVFENEDIKKEIFFLPDDPFYTSNITPEGLLDFYSVFHPADRGMFVKFCNDANLAFKKPIRNFSKGMKRQVYIGLALCCKPKYLLLDEAFDGLDPLARLKFKNEMTLLNKEKQTTVIISSHSLRELEDVCDSYGLIDNHILSDSGVLSDKSDNVYKFQLAFVAPIDAGMFDFPLVNVTCIGRVAKVIAEGNKNEILEKLKAMNPLIIDELPVDFEELFIYKVKGGQGK